MLKIMKMKLKLLHNAGKENSVIITTSISGRGVDIQLGGKKNAISNEQLDSIKKKSNHWVVCL